MAPVLFYHIYLFILYFINFYIKIKIFINYRLLKYDPKTKKNTVLMKNIMFANGVELSEDESFILISETHKNRILK